MYGVITRSPVKLLFKNFFQNDIKVTRGRLRPLSSLYMVTPVLEVIYRVYVSFELQLAMVVVTLHQKYKLKYLYIL